MKQLNDVQKIVTAWKEALGVDSFDTIWDKIHWSRCSRSGKNLLLVFNEDVNKATECLKSIYQEMERKNLDCTLETVVRKAHQWKYKNQAPKPESNESKLMRRVCTVCKGGRIEPHDDNEMRCNMCNADYTDRMAKIELRVA